MKNFGVKKAKYRCEKNGVKNEKIGFKKMKNFAVK